MGAGGLESIDGPDAAVDRRAAARMAVRALAFDRTAPITALIDPDGIIVDTNIAWRLFAQANGGHTLTTGPGASYLGVCDRAAADGDELAAAVAAGVRSVLGGERGHFQVEYPCGGELELRWFVLSVSALALATGTGATVSHVEVTSARLRRNLFPFLPEHDGATGLWNPTGGARLAKDLLAIGRTTGIASSIVRLHLGGLHDVTASHGEPVRAELLMRLVGRVRVVIGMAEEICLIEPSELSILCPGASEADAATLAGSVLDALEPPVQIGDLSLQVWPTATLVTSTDGSTVESFLHAVAGRPVEHEAVTSVDDGLPPDEGGMADDLARRLASPLQHRAIIDSLGEGVIVQDTVGTVLFANPRARALLGAVDLRTMTPRAGWRLVGATGAPIDVADRPSSLALRRGTPAHNAVLGLLGPDGEQQWFEVSSHPVSDPDDDQPYGVVISLRDVTRQREAGDRLRMQAHLLDSVGQAVVAWDKAGIITFLNAAAKDLYGLDDAAVGRPVLVAAPAMESPNLDAVNRAMDENQRWEGELLIARTGRPPVPIWTINTPVLDGDEVIGHIGVSSDITERKEVEQQCAHKATHDLLTDLPNRRGIIEHVETALASPGKGPIGVVLLDLADLDTVNDLYGHAVGDRCVVESGDRLRLLGHPGDLIGRWSDQSLAVCCAHQEEGRLLEHYAEELRLGLARPLDLDGVVVSLRTSAGVASASDPVGAPELLRRIDTARLRARTDHTTVLYDEDLDAVLRHQAQMDAIVEQVLASGEVGVGYQPLVRLDDERILGAEALLRVTDVDGTAVSAIELVRAAERTGKIGALGELVLRQACLAVARWRQDHPEHDLHVAVNVSAHQLDDSKLPGIVADALQVAGIEGPALWLEVTETALMRDPAHSIRMLTELKALGVTLAADDFGTGYSSLSHLKRYPLDILKVDQSFVAGLPEDLEDLAIARAVVVMSEALGLEVVAEGVEQVDQRDLLRSMGVAFGQGYLWSRAVPAAAFEALLEQGEAQPDAPLAVPAPLDWAETVDRGSEEERIDAVLRTIGHELRGPLSVVVGYGGMLADGTDPEVVAAGAAVMRAGGRIEGLLRSVIDVPTAPAALGRLVVADAEDIARQAVADHPGLPAGIEVAVSSDDPALVAVDPDQIHQVLANLLGNAQKYSPAGSPIEVAVDVHDDWVDVSVSDRGQGVEPSQIGTIFRKYGRADRVHEGTGLGLYVARRIARSHGGEVRYLRRNPGPGSTFTLRLPRSDEPAA